MTGPSGNFNTRPRYYDLPNIPANAYQQLSNLADAIDTANTKLKGHADKLNDITTSTNNAVNHVTSTSKGQATDTLTKVWQDSQKDLGRAQGQLEQITTSSNGLGPIQSQGQTGFRATLDMSKATIQKGVQALENIQNQQNGHATTLATNQQLEQWKQEVDDLNNSMSNLNLIIDGLAMLICKLNDGFSSTCATGFNPGGTLPLFPKNAFASQTDGGSSGSTDDKYQKLSDHIYEKEGGTEGGGNKDTADLIATFAETAHLNPDDVQALIDTGVDPQQVLTWLENGNINATNLNDVTDLLKKKVSPDAINALFKNGIDPHNITTTKTVDMAINQELVRSGGTLEKVLRAIQNRFLANPPTSLNDAYFIVIDATADVYLDPGDMVQRGSGYLIFKNRGGIYTTILSSGEIIVTRGLGGPVLLTLIP